MVLGGASPPPNRLPYLPFPNQNYSSPNSPRFRALGFEEMTHSGKPLYRLKYLITPFQSLRKLQIQNFLEFLEYQSAEILKFNIKIKYYENRTPWIWREYCSHALKMLILHVKIWIYWWLYTWSCVHPTISIEFPTPWLKRTSPFTWLQNPWNSFKFQHQYEVWEVTVALVTSWCWCLGVGDRIFGCL